MKGMALADRITGTFRWAGEMLISRSDPKGYAPKDTHKHFL